MGALNTKGVRVDLLNDEAVRLLFDMDVLVDVEDDYGSLTGFELALATKPFRTVRYAFWKAGRWVGDPALKPETAEAMGAHLDGAKTAFYIGKLTEALYESLGISKEEAEVAANAMAEDPTLAAALASLSPSSAPPPAPPGSPPVSETL